MDRETSIALCHSLSKAYTTGVRLYEGRSLLYYYSVCHIEPDPFPPYLERVMEREEKAGLITTEVFQFYGYITLPEGERIILGPTRILQSTNRDIELMLAVLGIGKDKKEEYLNLLYSTASAKVIHRS